MSPFDLLHINDVKHIKALYSVKTTDCASKVEKETAKVQKEMSKVEKRDNR